MQSTPAPLATRTSVPLPLPTSTINSQSTLADDWITFAHDYERTGYEINNTAITARTVGTLALRWKASVGGYVYNSPLVYAGNVVVETIDGTVYDFAAASGKLLWKRTIGGELRATPSIADGLVFVGNRFATPTSLALPSYVYALRLLDGAVVWRVLVNGVTHASPVVAQGRVYVGTAGGDPPNCLSGGITALDESSGAQVWRWAVDPRPRAGGSVWGAISYDGTYLFAGTGNTCETPIMTANGAVALTTSGNVAWSFVASRNSYIDDDSGGGVLISRGKAMFVNKNGSLYFLDAANGRMFANVPLGAADQFGGYATPTTDGSTIFTGAGLFPTGPSPSSELRMCALGRPTVSNVSRLRPESNFAGYDARLRAVNLGGAVVWSKRMSSRLNGYVAIANGMAFAGLDDTLTALDARSGTSLWSYTAASEFEASPVVVTSGLYAADTAGNVYAFAIPSIKALAR